MPHETRVHPSSDSEVLAGDRRGQRPSATMGPHGRPLPLPYDDRVLKQKRRLEEGRNRATYKSRTRLGNGSRTAASRIPRVCVSATRRRRSSWRDEDRTRRARYPPLPQIDLPTLVRGQLARSSRTGTPWRPLTNEHGVLLLAYESVLCPVVAFADASQYEIGQSRAEKSTLATLRMMAPFPASRVFITRGSVDKRANCISYIW